METFMLRVWRLCESSQAMSLASRHQWRGLGWAGQQHGPTTSVVPLEQLLEPCWKVERGRVGGEALGLPTAVNGWDWTAFLSLHLSPHLPSSSKSGLFSPRVALLVTWVHGTNLGHGFVIDLCAEQYGTLLKHPQCHPSKACLAPQ